MRVPSGAPAAFGQKSLAWGRRESGVGSLAGRQRETKKGVLSGEARGIGTEFLEGVRLGPGVKFLPAGRGGMTEGRSAGSPCPTAGPVFKERKEDSIEGQESPAGK